MIKKIGLFWIVLTAFIIGFYVGSDQLHKTHIERAEYILNTREFNSDLSSSIRYVLFGFEHP